MACQGLLQKKLSTSETVKDPEPEASENHCSEELGEKGLGTELNLKAGTESTAGSANEPTCSTDNTANDKLNEMIEFLPVCIIWSLSRIFTEQNI